jgi:hypothetical protein
MFWEADFGSAIAREVHFEPASRLEVLDNQLFAPVAQMDRATDF